MIFVGIDGGATNTRVVLASERGSILGHGIAGPSNYDNVGVDAARTHIATALQNAYARASLSPAPAEAAFFGMAGVVSEEDRDVIRSIAVQCDIAPITNTGIDHDIRIALAGGLAGKEGIVLIAGTGSSCYGRRYDGRNHRTGWGYLLDDLGSGYFLGMQAMIASIQEADGRGIATRLSNHVQERLGYKHIDDIMRVLYHNHLSVTEIASLAPIVLESAEAGDAVALSIVQRGAEELSRMVDAVARTLQFHSDAARITSAGGLMQSRFYKQHIDAAVKRKVASFTIQDAELPPVLGAVILAMETGRMRPNDAVLSTLKHESRKLQ